MKLTALLFAMTLSVSSWAASHEVLQVTNDKDSRIVTLMVETNGAGEFENLRQLTTQSGATISDYKISEAKGKSGASLFTEGKIEVIRIKISDRFEPVYGGPVKLDYLVNGIKGSRQSVDLEAAREGSKWVIKFKGSVVKRGHVISNRLLGKVIGVSQIKF